ncbi:response regulator with CheY-like receiver domain and winged-helix DNA-binding domain [Rivularia sp. PCC 7116]|uniref:response regulator transcription factor n=1 Tax=Rivularia sp. PCC 7116 TaxID=373994 RepID=UPI00029F48BB|nr:response regulator [Rivularia sp. PCC 7116]AFY56684.1 response regulator with CheY-like receiver domain and winged-helix DNA-binding domain [Rivularia sp. PCC 7116]
MATVLVVEDTPSQLELMNIFLQEGGYEVIRATDAKDGLEKALLYQPDAIITDVVMPGMSGFEFCRKLKRNLDTKKIPIIFCSSKNKDIDRIWGMRQGADFYLTKPFTRQQLIGAVKSVVI